MVPVLVAGRVVPAGVGLGPVGQVDARAALGLGQDVPEFLGGVGDDRRQEPGEILMQLRQDVLRGATVGAVGGLGVDPEQGMDTQFSAKVPGPA